MAFHWVDNGLPGDTNGSYDVFVHDRLTDTTTRISVGPGGALGDRDGVGASISADGRTDGRTVRSPALLEIGPW